MGLVLRPYQVRAIAQVRESILAGNKRPLIVMPTGSGKSPVFAKIAQSVAENGKKVLFLVHRRNLVFQLEQTLVRHFDIVPGIIMAGVKSHLDRQVQLASIQTYGRRLDLDELVYNPHFIEGDVVLIDECHRAISKQFQEVIKLYKDKIVIGCTATPVRFDGRGLGEVFNALVDVIGIKELTKQGCLSPVRYFVPGHINLEGVKTAMGDYQAKSLAEKTNTKKLIGDIVENWLRLAENRKTIVFCVNVKHSIAISDAFNAAGIPADYLNARHSDEERDYVFKRMDRGDITVLVNVALFQEGLDVPDVSCIVIARPTKSMGLFRQMCGRGLRPQEGKTCLLLDHGNVIETHGLLEWDIEWSLNGKKKAWSKPTRETTKKLVRCRACGLTFEGSKTCPDCGTEVRSFGKKIETIDAELEEIKPEKGTVVEKRLFLGMLKAWVPRQKNPNPKRVLGAFRGRYGVWPAPSYKNVAPIEPDQAFRNYMKYEAIKWAKGQKKEKPIKTGLKYVSREDDKRSTERLIAEYNDKRAVNAS